MSGIPGRNPFTAAQWQDLEHQALFFKFMVSGLPIPPDLISSIKGRTSLPHHIGWACFQQGVGQKNIDPAPNRCRRTDGKKWRCSRQTTGDSKYCERHLHRGKSMARKLHPDSSRPLQTYPYKSCSSTPTVESSARSQQSASAGAGTHSNSSNLSSVTFDKTHYHHFDIFNTHSSKPVKDSNFITFLGIETPENSSSQKGGETIMYHQFIEESPPQAKGRRDSWLNLNLNLVIGPTDYHHPHLMERI